MQEIIIGGNIFVYAHIIRSQGVSIPIVALISKSSDEEALSLEIALRRTVEGIRSFWRQKRR
jgi:hypothetical protein